MDQFYWHNIKKEIKIECFTCERCRVKNDAQHKLRAALISTPAGFI